MEALCREFRVALPSELLYADDLVVIAETEDVLIKRLYEWKDNVENRGMRVNINKTKVMISGEWQKLMQKAVRWPFGICGRGAGNNSISLLVVRSGCPGNVVDIKGSMWVNVSSGTGSPGLFRRKSKEP